MKNIYKVRVISFFLILVIQSLVSQGNAQTITIDTSRIKGNIDRSLFSIVGYDEVMKKGNETAIETYKTLNLKGTYVRLGAGINDVEPTNDDSDPFHFNWEGFRLKEMFGVKKDSREFIEEIREQGMEPVILFCYNSFWLGENKSVTAPPTNYDEWSEYACAVLERFNGNGASPDYKPIVKYAEIWNEPGEYGLYWSGDRFQYYKLFNNVAERIHKNYPGVLVGGPSVLNGSPIFLKDFVKHCGKNVDFLTYHIYGKNAHEMKIQIESWVNYAREATGKKDLRMMITESDNISIPEMDKNAYLMERQFALMNLEGILEGFHQFCAIAYGEGSRNFGLLYPDGGIIPHNYWAYWIFRNLEGDRIETPAPPNENILMTGSCLQDKGKINLVIFSREQEKSHPIDLRIHLKPIGENRIVRIEKLNGNQRECYGAFFLSANKEETKFNVNLEPRTAYSIVISKSDLYSEPIIESRTDKTRIYMGDSCMFYVKVINPFETPISGRIVYENLPARWKWMSRGGTEFKNLQQGFSFESRYSIQSNSPTSMKDGVTIHEAVYWKAAGADQDTVSHSIPIQIFSESSLEFDSLPHLIYAKPGTTLPLSIGVTNLSHSLLEGKCVLSHGFELPGQLPELARMFKIDQTSRIEFRFDVVIPPKPSRESFDIAAKILIGETEIKKDMQLIIKDYEILEDVLPVDLRNHFNADTLSFNSHTDDMRQSGGSFSFPAEFFPEPGIKEILGARFYIPDKTDGMNNTIRVEGQKISFKPDRYAALHLLTTAINGNKELDGAIVQDDGSTIPLALQISDWCGEPQFGDVPVIKATHRHSFGGDVFDAEPSIYLHTIPIKSDRNIKGIILPASQDLFIYAMTLEIGAMKGTGVKEKDEAAIKPGDTLIFKADFSKSDLTEEWHRIGSIEPFNRMETKNGVLELEGGIGDEWFGLALKKEFDWGESPLTLRIRYIHNAKNAWSELGFWLVKKLYTVQNPWNREDFIRLLIYNKETADNSNADFLKAQRDFGGGVGKTLSEITGLERGKPYDLEITLTGSRFIVSVNGEMKASGIHDMDFTTGYFYITDDNSLKGDMDIIEKLEIFQ
ncbi:hypothetical protein JW926_07420 [Candidatus Sumerlaeota bacterium]|nr:hypothetical protein [Candidatus Sumerlaeota bacterium]